MTGRGAAVVSLFSFYPVSPVCRRLSTIFAILPDFSILAAALKGNNSRRGFVDSTLLVVTVVRPASRSGHRTEKIAPEGLTVKAFFVTLYVLLP